MSRSLAVTSLIWSMIGATAVGVLAQQAPSAEDAHRLHHDPAAYVAALEDPSREAWQKPHEVVSALDVKAGDVIADIGAGSGYFTLRFAHHVGPDGRVFAVDVSPDMIRHLENATRSAGVGGVTTVLAPPDDPQLPAGSIDLVFICDTWHHIENRPAYLQKVRAALKPGGRLVIVDFHRRDLPVGPPQDLKIAREDVLAELRRSGFTLLREHTFLPYQYFLEFTP